MLKHIFLVFYKCFVGYFYFFINLLNNLVLPFCVYQFINTVLCECGCRRVYMCIFVIHTCFISTYMLYKYMYVIITVNIYIYIYIYMYFYIVSTNESNMDSMTFSNLKINLEKVIFVQACTSNLQKDINTYILYNHTRIIPRTNDWWPDIKN